MCGGAVVLLGVAALWRAALAFTLEGSQESHIRFPKWYQAFENTLSLEFRTKSPDGLLVYTDDGGRGNFYELTLVAARLQLRLKIGRKGHRPEAEIPTEILEIGDGLADGRWHRLQVDQFWQDVKIQLDDKPLHRKLKQTDLVFGKYQDYSDVFAGGIPPGIPDAELSSPMAKYKPHFAGSLRNVVYRTLPHGVTAPHPLDSVGTRETEDDYCLSAAFCRHDGRCFSTNAGPRCDCSRVPDFTGDYCQNEIPAPQASFFGGEFLSYDFSETRNGVNSREEELSLMFKTTRPDAMLFYAGDIQDYIHVALKGGAAVATSNLGSGPRNITIDPFVKDGGLKFNDNNWHHLILHRRLTTHKRAPSRLQMSLRVDGQHAAVEQTEGHMEWLSHVVAYVGAKPGPKILPPRLLTTPFVGCLSKVRYRADNRYLDFLEMARKAAAAPSAAMVRTSGNVSWTCRDASSPRPVSFLSNDAFLALPSWDAPAQGVLSFKFRSNEPDGLLLFNGGPLPTNASSDFVAFELVGGRLFFAMSLGSGRLRLQASAESLVDKTEWHSVTLIRDAQRGSVLVDQLKTEFATPGKAKLLDLGGALFLGGLDWVAGAFPPSVWSAGLRRGFLGCLRDVSLNGISVELVRSLQQPSARRSVEAGCAVTVDLCPAAPCRNGASCSEGWGRFRCDCARTSKEGPTCARDPMRVSFEKQDQLLRVQLPRMEATEAEDIMIKFQTKRTAGYLVGTSSSKSFDRLDVSVYDGQIYAELKFGSARLKPVRLSGEVADGRWHSLRLQRRGSRLRLALDGGDPDVFEISGGSGDLVLHYDTLWAGHSEAPESGLQGPGNVIPKIGFMGQMAGFRFNGRDVFTMAADLESGLPFLSRANTTSSLRIPEWSKPPTSPISLTSRSGFLQLPESLMSSAALLHLFLQFRTLETDGLLLYAAGLSRDFFAVELDGGHVRYSFNSGDGPQALVSKAGGLGDFAWHRVQIYQATPSEHFLVVDNATTKISLGGPNTQLNLRGVLSVGGVEPGTPTPPAVISRHGFRGCLASFAVGHVAVDLLNENLRMESVQRDCVGPEVSCSAGSCESGGVCRQHWSSTSCDCALTTRTGPRCDEPGTGFGFGPGAGAVLWEWPEGQRPSTGADILAVGIQTRSEADAVLFRVDSQSPKDFLQLEISGGGFASVSYNLGGQSYRVGDLMRRVNDGEYHVVRFTRDAANATFQLDSHSRQYKTPPGQQLQTLNQQAWLSVGGRVDAQAERRRRRDLRIAQPFHGTLSGLNFNGLYVLERAAEGDRRARVLGSARLLRSKGSHQSGPNRVRPLPSEDDFASKADLTSRMMSSSSSVGPPDDSIITTGSGLGSGCQSDEQLGEDDECVYDEDPASEELITPDYERMFTTTRRTPPPTTTTETTTTTPTTTTTTTTTKATTTTTQTTTTTTRTVLTTPPPIYFTSDERIDYDDGIEEEDGSGAWEASPDYSEYEDPLTSPRPPPTESLGFADFSPPQPPILPVQQMPKQTERKDSPGVKMDPPRPTAPGGGELSPTTVAATTLDPEAFDRTGFISGISIALILFTAFIVFLVFKCYNRSKASGLVNSYAVEEGATKGMYASEVAPGAPTPIITTRVASVNGYSAMKPVAPKKKKDFKEWYV